MLSEVSRADMKALKYILALAVFIAGFGLVLYGHTVAGPLGLGIMIAGLLILLALLYMYNRKYQ